MEVTIIVDLHKAVYQGGSVLVRAAWGEEAAVAANLLDRDPSSSGGGRDADRDVVKGFNEFFARHTIMHNTNLMTFAVGERAAISIRRGERRG